MQEEANLPQFEGSDATTDFIRKSRHGIDMLNSRNPFAGGVQGSIFIREFINVDAAM